MERVKIGRVEFMQEDNRLRKIFEAATEVKKTGEAVLSGDRTTINGEEVLEYSNSVLALPMIKGEVSASEEQRKCLELILKITTDAIEIYRKAGSGLEHIDPVAEGLGIDRLICAQATSITVLSTTCNYMWALQKTDADVRMIEPVMKEIETLIDGNPHEQKFTAAKITLRTLRMQIEAHATKSEGKAFPKPEITKPAAQPKGRITTRG